MLAPLFWTAILVAIFVGYNIGGATTAPAFAPAIGANLISKAAAGVFMAICFFLGAWTIGRRVVDTLGDEIVHDTAVFTPESSLLVLGFIGVGLFLGNAAGIPASTSMTTVGAIAGLAAADGQLNWTVTGEIVAWWLVTPLIGFAACAIVGRYFYPTVEEHIDDPQHDERLLTVKSASVVPRPVVEVSGRRERLVGLLVVCIGGLMGFSSGASNIANVIAPLVGSGQVTMNPGILFGSAAVAIGALTIGRRTLETLGNEITSLPLPASFVVAPTSAIIVIFLAAIGIPASFVIIATFCIAGLGWGRMTRRREKFLPPLPSVGDGDLSLSNLRPNELIPDVRTRATRSSEDVVFDPRTTAQVVVLQHCIPGLVTIGSYLTFRTVPLY